MKIKTIVVEVRFLDNNDEELACSNCYIAIDKNPINVSKLTDACQRSVAHCVDELEKHLDNRD